MSVLVRPTKVSALIHLLKSIDDSLIADGADIAQSKIHNLVTDLADRASKSADNTFAGLNIFAQPVQIANAVSANQAVTLQQLNAGLAGLDMAIHAPSASVAAAQAIPSADLANSEIMNITSTNALWRYDSTSMAVEDGVGVIKPTDVAAGSPGRWVYFLEQSVDMVTLGTAQQISGVKTFTASPVVPDATGAGQAVNFGQLSALQNEVNALETGLGMNTDGTYSPDSFSNYGSTATNLRQEVAFIDAATKAASQASSNEATRALAAEAAIQAELDATQAASGLNADGTHVGTTGNYTSAATTLAGEIAALDAQALVLQNEIDAEATSRASADTAIKTAVGLNSNGTHAASTGHYTSAATSIEGEIVALDAQVFSDHAAITALQAATGAGKTEYVVYIDNAAIGTTDLPITGGYAAMVDDETVQLWVNGFKWRKGASRQFTVTAGGNSLTIFGLEEVSDIEFRYLA
jgi:hypothetical protein